MKNKVYAKIPIANSSVVQKMLSTTKSENVNRRLKSGILELTTGTCQTL